MLWLKKNTHNPKISVASNTKVYFSLAQVDEGLCSLRLLSNSAATISNIAGETVLLLALFNQQLNSLARSEWRHFHLEVIDHV